MPAIASLRKDAWPGRKMPLTLPDVNSRQGRLAAVSRRPGERRDFLRAIHAPALSSLDPGHMATVAKIPAPTAPTGKLGLRSTSAFQIGRGLARVARRGMSVAPGCPSADPAAGRRSRTRRDPWPMTSVASRPCRSSSAWSTTAREPDERRARREPDHATQDECCNSASTIMQLLADIVAATFSARILITPVRSCQTLAFIVLATLARCDLARCLVHGDVELPNYSKHTVEKAAH